MKKNNFWKLLIAIVCAFIFIQECKSPVRRWNVPDSVREKDLVIVRRFNTAILQIDNKSFSKTNYDDFALSPGKHKLTILIGKKRMSNV